MSISSDCLFYIQMTSPDDEFGLVEKGETKHNKEEIPRRRMC